MYRSEKCRENLHRLCLSATAPGTVPPHSYEETSPACTHKTFPASKPRLPVHGTACMHKTSPQPNKKTRSSPGKRQQEPRDSSRHCSTQRQRHPIIPAWSRSKNKNVSAGGTSILERFRAFFFSVGKELPPGGSGPSPAWACRCACCPARSAKTRSAEIRFPSRQRRWPA